MEVSGFGITGLGGDTYGNIITQAIAASGNYVIPAGVYTVVTDANGTVQINLSGTWTSLGAAGTGFVTLHTEGTLFRVLASASGSTLKLIPIKNTNF